MKAFLRRGFIRHTRFSIKHRKFRALDNGTGQAEISCVWYRGGGVVVATTAALLHLSLQPTDNTSDYNCNSLDIVAVASAPELN